MTFHAHAPPGALPAGSGNESAPASASTRPPGPRAPREVEKTERIVHIAFAIALLCMAAIGIVAHRSVVHLREDTRLIEHTHQVLRKLEGLSSDLTETQNGVRGFTLTGEKAFLATVASNTAAVTGELEVIARETADSPELQRRVQQLSETIQSYLGFDRRLIEARQERGFDAARALMLSNEGERFRRNAAAQIAGMQEVESKLLLERQQSARRSATMTDGVILAACVLAVVLVGVSSSTIRRDLIGRRHAEEALAAANRALQERASEVERANRELEAFSYSVSHDLRAPLRHVDGYSELLEQELGDNVSPEGRKYLETIKRSVGKMNTLIDQLLSFSRMNRVELQQGVIDLPGIVAEVRQELEMATAGRAIEWQIRPLPRVEGDRAMIKQVFANLLNNAVKYSRPRERAIIEVGWSGDRDGRALLFVRDNGVGFDMAHTEKLFAVFERLHPATQFEGNGIGLANVQRVIERHGGRVWAEAAVDKGATFYFTLRRVV
jgi:signal transduction histidine kinase